VAAVSLEMLRARRLAAWCRTPLRLRCFSLPMSFTFRRGDPALIAIPILIALLGVRPFRLEGVDCRGACRRGDRRQSPGRSRRSLRLRLSYTIVEVQTYRSDNAITSAGLRLEFWKKSMSFRGRRAALWQTARARCRSCFAVPPKAGAAPRAWRRSIRTIKYLAVAIQLGIFGLIILIAMWVAHFALFRGSGLACLARPGDGLCRTSPHPCSIRICSIPSTAGCTSFGVGVLGGMVLHQAATAERTTGGAA